MVFVFTILSGFFKIHEYNRIIIIPVSGMAQAYQFNLKRTNRLIPWLYSQLKNNPGVLRHTY